MKNKVFLILILFSSMLQACKQPDNNNNNKVDTLLLKQVFEAKNEALIDHDSKTLSTMTHPNVRYGHSNGWVQDYNTYTFQDNSDSLYYQTIDIDNVDIDVVDNTGIVVGEGRFAGIVKQDSFDLTLSFIETYVYQQGKWYLLARQSTKSNK